MKTIALPTTPAQREVFKDLGLILWGEQPGREEHWDLNGAPIVRLYADRESIFYNSSVMISAQVLQILGLLPPPEGMVIIPREAARLAATAMWVAKYNMNRAADRWDKQGSTKAAEDCRRRVCKMDEAIMAIREALIGFQASTPTTPEQGTEDEPHVR